MQIKKLLVIMALTIISITAYAGYAQPAPVTITDHGDGSFTASGDMWTARSAKSDFTSIGCGTKKFSGDYSWGFCQATDEDDQYVNCWTGDAHLLDAISAVNDSSYIRFDVDTNGDCVRIDVSSQSLYAALTTTKGKQ